MQTTSDTNRPPKMKTVISTGLPKEPEMLHFHEIFTIMSSNPKAKNPSVSKQNLF